MDSVIKSLIQDPYLAWLYSGQSYMFSRLQLWKGLNKQTFTKSKEVKFLHISQKSKKKLIYDVLIGFTHFDAGQTNVIHHFFVKDLHLIEKKNNKHLE